MIELGTVVADLRIDRELGRGAFGCVYLAHDNLIGREVALKVVPDLGAGALPGERERILREARTAGRLNHPNVVVLYRVHPPDDRDFWMFEMEYVSGGALSDLLAAGDSLEFPRVRAIFSGIAGAMRAAAAAGIVHGDIKPGNVMLTADGIPKLADFGLSRFLGEESVSASSAGGLVGTPMYAAPELVMGQRPSLQSDLWSLGCVLYRMLTGRLPFAARDLTAQFYAVLNTAPPPLPARVPQDLADLALRLLSRDPVQRGDANGLEPVARPLVVAETAPRAPWSDRSLTGRDAECDRLRTAIEKLRSSRTGGTIVIGGELGVGKSELARWALKYARACGLCCCESQVNSIEGLMRPFFTALRDDLDSSSFTAQPDGTSAWDIARRYAEDPTATARTDVGEPAWAMENTIRDALRSGPLVALIDDAQFLNQEELSIVRQLGRRLHSEGLLLLLAGRRTADEGTGGDPSPLEADSSSLDAESMRLEPLDRESSYLLLREHAGAPSVAAEVARRILEIAGGNPLFILETLRHMQEARVVTVESQELVRGPAWEQASVPNRLRQLFQARVRSLPDEQRDLLDVAAVDGVEFSARAIAAVLELPELGVLRELQRLHRGGGLIAPLERGYSFRSALVRSVLYREIAPEFRCALHARLAEYYDRDGTESISPERLAEHFNRAGDAARAAPLYLAAAWTRAERQDPERAILFAERGGIRPEGTEPELLLEHADLVLAVGGLYSDHGRLEEAEGLLGSLQEAASARDDARLVLRTRVVLQLVRLKARGIDAVSPEVLAEAADGLPGTLESGRAHYALGLIAIRAGRLEDATRHCTEADRVFIERKLGGLHSSALNALASIANRRQDWENAERLYDESAEESRRVGRAANAAISELNGGMSAFRRGRLDGARPRVERAVRVLELEGSVQYAAHARVYLAEIQNASGEFDSAEETVAAALTVLEEGKLQMGLVAALSLRARLEIVRGALESALLTLARALELARKAGDAESQAQIALVASRAHLLQGDTDRATGSFAEAIDLTETTEVANLKEELPQALLESALFGLPAADVHRLAETIVPRDETARMIVRAADQWLAGDATIRRGARGGAGRPLGGARLARTRSAAHSSGRRAHRSNLGAAGRNRRGQQRSRPRLRDARRLVELVLSI